MAVIGKIRQRSGLLIFLIGAAIAGFLIMDATNSQFSVLKGRKDSIGKVNGEKITYNEYSRKYEDNIKKMEDQMRGQPIGEEQRNYIRTQTWNEMVNDIIFDNVYDKLGVNVTGDEMTELAIGENASPYIKQQFKNPQTGRFDPGMVRTYLTRLDQDPEGAEPGTTRKQWMNFETMLKQSQFQQKYNNLIGKAFYVPTWQAEMVYDDQNRFANVKYLALSYSDVNDADVKVSDDDLKKYVQDHAGKFKQDEETRKIAYVTFDIAASGGDSAKTIQSLEEKRAEFAKGEKPSDDSIFVKLYSETPFDVVYYTKDQVSPIIVDSAFGQPKGTVIGPYLDGAQYKLAKITDRKTISDSVRVKDIRISFAGITTQDQANQKFKLIDSIYKQIDSLKGDFSAFAMAFSDEEASKAHGGDLGWIKPAQKEKFYNDLIFYRAQKGKLYKVPNQTENAIHLIEVTDEKPSKMAVEVSYFTKEIIPSPETERNIYGTATTFASENQNEAKFKAAGEKLRIKTINSLKKDAFTVEGLGTARDLVKWAFNAKKGDVSPVFTVDKKHVVAMLQEIRPKGLPDIEALRDAIKPEVVKEKKFEILSKKITDAKANGIDELASKLGKTAEQAEHISFGSANLNGAFEPKVAATAIGMPAGKMSAPVEGLRGVYVVQTLNVQEPAKPTDLTPYTFQMKQQLMGKARYAQDVEKKLAKIDDNRFDFF